MKKNSQHLLNKNLCEYIRSCIVVYFGNGILQDVVGQGDCLPTRLMHKVYEDFLIDNNKAIYEITKTKKIDRADVFEFEFNDKELSKLVLNFQGIEIFKLYKKHTMPNDDFEYLNFASFNEISVPENLKDFKLMIEYFARIILHKEIIDEFTNNEKGGKSVISNFKKPRLQTKFNDTQRGKLFDLLVLNEFIPDKDKEGFIWAFGGVNDNYSSYSTEWLKNKNLGVYLIDSICIDNGKLWAIGSRIFDIKNMAQIKQNYFSINQTSKPKGHELIDKIILEAQK